jgi:hypothetical protein
MGTSSRLLVGLAAAAALALAGCGGAAATHHASRPATGSATHHASRPAGPFAWLAPTAAPAGWTVARLPSGRASLAYPPGWKPIRTDPGTFSAALLGPHEKIRGYLNATPQSGAETLANWARFRPAHNHEEGDRHVVREASAQQLRFRAGRGSCVVDRYATASARYREIACIVRGSRATTVVVAAARPQDWARLAPQLQRAVASFTS